MIAVRRILVPTMVALALLLGGCGTDTAPSSAVPELAERLDAVDAAVVADDPDRIRTTARRLIATAEDAGESGELDATQVESIVAAAEGLLAELPAKIDPPEPSPTTTSPTPTPTPSPTPSEKGEEVKEEGDEKPGKGKGHGKKEEKDD